MATKASSPAPQTVTLTQQSVNLVRQLVNAIGWAKTIEDIALGGEILLQVLPEPDPIDWIKTEQEILAMDKATKDAYLAKDRAWASKPCKVTVTAAQSAVIAKAFTHGVEEMAKAGRLGPSVYFSEIMKAFDIKAATEKS